MRVLVTGATGYTGLIVADSLTAAGMHVRGLASRPGEVGILEKRKNFSLQQGDLRDPSALARAVRGVDTIVHFAAVVGDPASARAPDLARQVNVEATKVLFDLANQANVRQFVFASTCSVYGRHVDGLATEITPLNPISLYGETKVDAEAYLLSQSSDVNITVLRLATAYGVSPRMRLDLLVNAYVQQAAQGHITVMGPRAWRPHTHVRDIADAVLLTLNTPEGTRGEIFNVVSENLQMQHVATLAAASCPNPVRISYRAQVDDRRDYAVDGSKLKNHGFDPRWTVRQGVAEVREHLLSGHPSSGEPTGPAQPGPRHPATLGLAGSLTERLRRTSTSGIPSPHWKPKPGRSPETGR